MKQEIPLFPWSMPFDPSQETYIHDGVYARFDGYQVWIRTDAGDSIALDDATLGLLLQYRGRVEDVLKKAENPPEPAH